MRVQLFATCLGDLLFPDAVADAEALLRAAGCEVEFPRGQTCCGQPAFNAGHRRASDRLARSFARAFDPDVPIVAPSGSCTSMVAHHMTAHFDVRELSSLLDELGAEPPARNDGLRLAYHSSCHMLRDLGIDEAPRRLLERTGAELVPLQRPDLCCGFGGTFSVRHPEVSVAMADDKLADGARADALVTADPGCLMHLRARAARTGAVRVVHLATALARGAA
ncbi:MAG TPA: (Fe-S)-binding protein [Gaiellaceae bacterium]|nr:(Fe-S)-binding protein [Gaiellaceae bacterium]